MQRGESGNNKIIFILAGLSLLIIFAIVFFLVFYKPSNPSSIFFKNNTVINVIDGDTFEYVKITDNSKLIVTSRLLCVDTPEEGEKGYQEAKEFLQSLILDKQVTFVSSISDKDAYGRELRYVYVGGVFVNKQILDNDYGELLIIPPQNCSYLLD